MESPRKNNDCYFYYYSTCTKGDTCTFRHEPSALGCETVCSFWKEGKCLNVHCSFRHMELRKNRKAIPCYWEAQPGGCLKPHCPFLHKSGKDLSSESIGSPELQVNELGKTLGPGGSQNSNDSDRKTNQYPGETNFGNAATVDPLVVKFEEESDNESAPTNSPIKPNQSRVVKVKTLEEIRLEKIQAESAAYYSYPGAEDITLPNSGLLPENNDGTASNLRKRIMKRLSMKTSFDEPQAQDFEVLTLDEIRKRKKRKTSTDLTYNIDDDPKPNKRKLVLQPQKDISEIKIKTLAEIRAEKLKRKQTDDTCSEEVTSTSNIEESKEETTEVPVKRQRRTSSSELSPRPKPKLNRGRLGQDVVGSTSPEKVLEEPHEESATLEEIEDATMKTEQSDSDITNLIRSQSDSSKLDDILLLDDEDIEETNINLKEEEDLLKNIDELLND